MQEMYEDDNEDDEEEEEKSEGVKVDKKSKDLCGKTISISLIFQSR